MNKAVLYAFTAAILLAEGAVAAPLSAELVMGKGRSWQGQILRRDGDWVEFSSGTSAKPIRIGVATIKELNFKVQIDTGKITSMMDELDYQGVITALNSALEPYAEYQDVPSNLTRYNALLMELYYRTEQYDLSLALSEKIVGDDRYPELQQKARIYRALAVIDAGNDAKLKTLLEDLGWEQEASADAAADELYIRAKLMVLNGNYDEAMETVAKIVAFHSQDPDWIQPAEMMCAEIYLELGMYDSAAEVCRQITLLYADTQEYAKAKQLMLKVDQLRAEQELNETLNQ
jgi:tetratricopeptide (TPR) repeat protein